MRDFNRCLSAAEQSEVLAGGPRAGEILTEAKTEIERMSKTIFRMALTAADPPVILTAEATAIRDSAVRKMEGRFRKLFWRIYLRTGDDEEGKVACSTDKIRNTTIPAKTRRTHAPSAAVSL